MSTPENSTQLMTRIYQVKYEEKWTGSSEWLQDQTKVVANGDAQKAVDKIKQRSLGRTFKAEDTGKIQKCLGFRLREVLILAEAE